MPRTLPRRPLPALTAACLAALVSLPGTVCAIDRPAKDFKNEGQFFGVGSCQPCHTVPRAPFDTDFVLLTEYTTWRTLDKHAQAYAALLTDRGKQIGKILGVEDVTKDEVGCMGCHSMGFTRGRRGRAFKIEDGVTCDGCHGPAEGWYGPHSGVGGGSEEWRLLRPEDKEKYGMLDVRDPVKKAEMCASCHVGNVEQGKVITHAMYAAGHPPLPPFEVETFCKNLPQHWRDRKDVPFFQKPPKDVAAKVRDIYHLSTAPVAQTQLTLAGSLAVLRAQMRVIADRANLDAKTDRAQRWPELALASFELPKDVDPTQLWPDLAMSHSDCYACHHELVTPSWRQQRGYDLVFPGGKVVGIPGRVQVRRWPFALAGWGPGDVWVAQGEDGKQSSAALTDRVRALYEACNVQPYGDPAKLRAAALGLSGSLKAPLAALTGDRLNTNDLQGLLQKLCTSEATNFADYETARQIASAFTSVYHEWDPKGDKAPGVRKLLAEVQDKLDVHPYIGRGKRLAILRARLAKEEGGDRLPGNADLLRALQESSSREYEKVLKGEQLRGFQRFLDKFQKVKDTEFSALMTAPESLTDINDIGNEELQRYLEATNRFDPVGFHNQMTELGRLVSGK
jgi:hypothetical protein